MQVKAQRDLPAVEPILRCNIQVRKFGDSFLNKGKQFKFLC